jgi:hypothetical protein
MKFFLKTLFIATACSVYSQNQPGCGFNYAQEELFRQDPSARQRFEKLMKDAEAQGQYKTNQVATYTIPVVFHVLHKGGIENISDAQIHSAIAILNRDFQKLNSDTTQIVTAFKNLAADCSIQFSLATIDENGQCTNGITRHYDNKTDWTVTASNYIYTWDPTKYLNIYVVKTLQSGAAAYTYLPGSTGASMDAIVTLHQYVGSSGTSSSGNSRTLTHEVGHWLNLQHVWGSTNNPGVACGDDGVSDTPITKGHSWCNLGSSSGNCTSGVTENIQNYMEYAYCSRMFTIGQRTRMHNALNSSIGGRDNLWTMNNLNNTGVLNPVSGCFPKAEFIATNSVTCVGGSLLFTDLSYNAPVTSWVWTSTLAANSSTVQNGSLTFTASGLAPVKLVAANINGSDSITKAVVTVMAGSGTGTTNIMQGFETDPFPNNNWVATQPMFGSAFVLNTSTGASGTNCVWVNNYFDNPNGPVAFFTPAYNLQNSLSSDLAFKYAYAQQNAMNDDNLKVSVSVNCGASWTVLFNKSGAALSTTGTLVTSNFLNPQPAQWKQESFNILAYSGSSQVYFKFEFTPDASSPGNNIFIDDILIDQTVGLKETGAALKNISVYPNPFDQFLTIRNSGTDKITSVKLFDVSMRQITSIATEQLTAQEIKITDLVKYNPGVYFAEIKTGEGSKVIKLIKQ